MANLRSFSGFLTLDVLGSNAISVGSNFTIPGTNPLDIIIQDGDAQLQGDSPTNEQSSDPQGDQIGFITNSNGDALADGQEIYVENSFTFTLDGAGSFTGYVLETEGSGQSYIVFPPGVAAGTINVTAINDAANNVPYTNLGSGDEEISQNDFGNLDLSGADTITSGSGNDTIDAGEGNDSVVAGAGGDTVFGNAGDDTVDGGSGNDSIRGDSGEDGVTVVRESFNWAQLGLNNGQTVPNNPNGIDQDTGNITVNLDYTELARFDDFEFRNDFAQNTSGIDTGGETIGNNVGFLVGNGTSPAGDTVSVDFNFSANAAGFENEVRNVQFRINDVDDATWRDIIEITALDANDNPVHVNLTAGQDILLSDEDGVNGFDTATAINGTGNGQPIDADNSLLVEIAGPVSSINIRYGNLETAGQRVDITDIFFDAVPTAIANVETGDDSLLGGAGDDTIFGEAGEDTIDGGANDDSIEGGANDDLLQLTDNFGNDTITGGEIGETTGDTLDGGALTEAVNVVYSGDEAGDALNSVTGDSAAFSEIEHINTGSGDDTIIGTLDTVGIDLNAGAGADTILGGQAGDTLNAGAGADTIDGQAGADTINAGGGDDEIQLTDGFGNDSIVGGENGETTGDTVSGATLNENVVVTYDGDESGNFVGQTSGDNAAFEEIEGVTTGSGDDTVDASADSTGQIITTNAGADSVLGGAGGDTVDAGAGDDTIFGGAGADSIVGGGGTDSLLGGTGADSIRGGDGDDTIDGGAGNDQILAGDDDDSVFGGDGVDVVSGGAGSDTLDGGEDGDIVTAGDGDDLIQLTGVFGDDLIIGGEGAETTGDTVSGATLAEDVVVTFSGDEAGTFDSQAGNGTATFSQIEAVETGVGDDTVDATNDTTGVTIITNEGEDVIIGGAGDDSIDAGDDDDTITFGQNDTVLGGAGADEFIIQPTTGAMTVIGDFDPSTNVDNTVIYDPANPPDQTDNDFVDLSGFFANINELRAANTPNGDGDVVLDLGDGQTLTFVGVNDVTLLNFENTNVVCFTRGALIRTPNGDVAVENLREGDLVETMDNGAQPIRWIGRRLVSAGMLDAAPRLRPVRIAKGALGANRDLVVSPQHRMLLTGDRAELMFGVDQVLVAAKDLVDGDMIHMGPVEDVEYFHILFDDHEIIFAEDAPTESFHPGEQALSTTTARMQAEIFELFPELADGCDARPTARLVLKSHEARAFAR